MGHDFLFETNRFNLSQVRPHFINDCCFGEDVAEWLSANLAEAGFTTIAPAQEDWGWYTEASRDGRSYFIAIGGNAAEGAADPNEGEWRIGLDRHRTLMDKLRGRNRMTRDDPIVGVVRAILEQQPDFRNVTEEPAA